MSGFDNFLLVEYCLLAKNGESSRLHEVCLSFLSWIIVTVAIPSFPMLNFPGMIAGVYRIDVVMEGGRGSLLENRAGHGWQSTKSIIR